MQSPKTNIAGRFFNTGFFASSSVIFAGSFVVNVLNYVFTLVMSRLLGVDAFGEVSAIISLVTIIGVPASALTMLMTREVAFRAATDKEGVRDLFIFLRKHVLTAAFLSWVVFLAVAPLISLYLHIPYVLFAVFSLILPFSAASALQTGTLQGLQEFFTLSKQSIISTVIKLLFGVLLVLAGFSVMGVIVALISAQAASWLFGYFATNSRLDLRSKAEPKASLNSRPIDSRPLRLFFTTTLITSFLLALLSNTDLLLAKHFLSATDAGEYGGLATIGNIITYGIGAFTTVLLPMAAAAHALGVGGERRILKLSLAVIAACTFAAWVLFTLFPSEIISVLFGARYLAVAPVMSRYAIAEGCTALSIALINYFVAIGNSSFLYMVGIAIATEVALIYLNHSSIAVIASMLVAASALMLVLLTGNYFFTTKPVKI